MTLEEIKNTIDSFKAKLKDPNLTTDERLKIKKELSELKTKKLNAVIKERERKAKEHKRKVDNANSKKKRKVRDWTIFQCGLAMVNSLKLNEEVNALETKEQATKFLIEKIGWDPSPKKENKKA